MWEKCINTNQLKINDNREKIQDNWEYARDIYSTVNLLLELQLGGNNLTVTNPLEIGFIRMTESCKFNPISGAIL